MPAVGWGGRGKLFFKELMKFRVQIIDHQPLWRLSRRDFQKKSSWLAFGGAMLI